MVAIQSLESYGLTRIRIPLYITHGILTNLLISLGTGLRRTGSVSGAITNPSFDRA